MKKIEQHVDVFYKWCCEKYGHSKYHKDFPTISIDRRGKRNYGWFCTERNHIHIYENMHERTIDLVDTIIHEWTHYMQPTTWLARYEKTHNYSENPYELEAQEVAMRDSSECFKSCYDELLVDNTGFWY